MKKLVGVAAIAVLGMAALSSCKKDYVCKDSDGDEISNCSGCKGLTKEAFESSCSLSGGTVSTK